MKKRLFSFLISFVSIFCISASIQAKAPWQSERSQKDRELPWGGSRSTPSFSKERKEGREGFFRSLQLPNFSLLSSSDAASTEPSHSYDQDQLESLPWKSYQKEWSLPYDSVFAWPVQGGKISSGFGMRKGRLHEGLDITATEGSQILSIGNGRVVYAGQMSGYGNIVVIYHGGGMSSVYAHNRENLVRVGDLVEKSQAIATLGRTGKVSGPHLHFEIRKDGKAINPLSYRFKRDWSQI